MTDIASLLAVVNASVQVRQPPKETGTTRDAATFARRMNSWAKVVRENWIPDVHRKIAAEALAAVVAATPVGDPSKWKRNIGKPKNKQQPKGYVGGNARRRWQIQMNGVTQTNTVAALNSPSRPDTTWRLFNDAPYIERLNRGWSRQAPAGFIERAVQAVTRKYSVVR